MDNSPRKLFAVATATALLTAALFYRAGLGINLALTGILLPTLIFALQKKFDIKLSRPSQFFLGVAAIFAILFAFRAAPGLQIANGFALIVALGASLASARSASFADKKLSHYLFQPFAQIPATIPAFAKFTKLVKPPIKAESRALPLTVGAMIATPLLMVFGGLFYSADALFRTRVNQIATLDWNLIDTLGFSFLAVTLLVFLGGAFHRYFLQPTDYLKETHPDFIGPTTLYTAKSKPTPLRLGHIEISTVLSTLVFLFAAFIATQFEALFGGTKVITATTGLTVAEYARSGFFQLVWVAALSLITILSLHSLQSQATTLNRWLSRSLVALVGLVIASAIFRMSVYTQAFGLTELRLYTTVFMVWLAIAFAWLIPTITANRPQKFGFGTLIAGFSVIALLNAANPEALITRTNLASANPDLDYIASLSPDAELAWRTDQSLPPLTRKSLSDRELQYDEPTIDWRNQTLTHYLLKNQSQKAVK
jgi:hypothetical protein